MKVLFSLLLGGLILYWMYRDFDFKNVGRVLVHEMDWTWMLLSFPFGVLAQMLRGWRWQMSLEPIGEHARASVSVNSIFLSYAVSLVVPRVGEFARCVVLAITLVTLFPQLRVFDSFFSRTGTNIETLFSRFSTAGYIVTAVCAVAAVVLLWVLLRRFSIYNKVKCTISGIMQGMFSLRGVSNMPLYALFTLGIWVSYFLHYYLTFFCFEATSSLGMACALVTFIVGSIAVIVPTPNGAGPWHFAVKTMLILYGVGETDALYFVLIVHSVQTLLVVLLGVWAWIALSFTSKKTNAVACAA